MQIQNILEYIPSVIGLLLVGVLLMFVLFVALSRVRRAIFGRKEVGDEHSTGIRGFFSNFD
jgi:fumarate reductase subunit D